MTRTNESNDVLEQNVSTLLESGGERPNISEAARARIRDELVAAHGRRPAAAARVRARTPLLAVGFGLAATAAAALVVAHVVGGDDKAVARGDATKLADGSTYIADAGAKVTVLGPRRVRVDGAALLDVVPGKGTFVVETARGRIEVLGTRFLVDAQAQKTTTAVVRGEVKLATEHGAVVVHAGEQAVAESGRAPVRGPAPRLSHLVSWAQHARRREENGVKPLGHGTLFAREPGVRPDGRFGAEYPLPIKQLTLDVVVEDRVARVALDQTFHNAQDRVLEGVYRFAIPPDAALQRLAMYIDGTLTESAVVERMRARRIYEELVYRRIDPALLEYAGTGRLDLRVYPIPAQQDKRLVLAYTQSIAKLYRDWTLSVPLPEVDQPVGELVVSARIKGCANCELTAPGQEVEIERTGNDAIIKLKRAGATIGDSFVVHVREREPSVTVARKADGKDRYVMVRAPAELGGTAREYRPRTWVILDDVSASRTPYELAAQADLVDAFLQELDENDKVSIVAFDVEARQLLAPARVNDVDRRAVRELIKEEGGVGATDFAKALDAAMTALAGVNPEDAMILYLGDGVITSGARNLDALRAQIAGKAQFVGAGVGDGPDTQTLDALAAATGGFSTTIDLADDVRWRAFDLVAALNTTRVTGVTARLVDATGAPVPAALYTRSAQLADGEEIELVAKLASDATPVAVVLEGVRAGTPWRQNIAIAEDRSAPGGTPPQHNADAGYLPRLWAQRHIAARMLAKHEPVILPPCTTQIVTRTDPNANVCPTEVQLRQERDEEIRREIVTLGKQYFLLSRHTSLLVLENDAMYAKYGVRKGRGDTWAPYALPAKLAVVASSSSTAVPDDVAGDAELVRAPLQVFYDHPDYSGDELAVNLAGEELGGSFGPLGGVIGAGFGRTSAAPAPRTRTEQAASEATRASLGLAGGDLDEQEQDLVPFADRAQAERSTMSKTATAGQRPGPSLRSRISTRELDPGRFDLRRDRVMRRANRHAGFIQYGVGQLTPMRYAHPSDLAFDDLSALIPALVPDAADAWREQLRAHAADAGSFPIDVAAKQLLQRARAQLGSGIYRWGDVELAVDGARSVGWRRTTDTGLGETASFDGSVLTRRYAELDLSVTRAVREDAVALAFAYLPIWIAEPEHYARWFVVTARGPREIGLSIRDRGKDSLAFVLRFDDKARLVALVDADGAKLLEVSWGPAGPLAARVLGGEVAVGFTAESIVDAARWAHRDAPAGVTVEMPTRLATYWRTAIDEQQPGSPAWRHASRQLLASAAALQDRKLLADTYGALREHGGVELGDLVLASGGVATAMTDAEFAGAVAPLAQQPLARYLIAGRAYGKAPSKPARLAPETRDGALGALWTLRSATAQFVANNGKAGVDELIALGDRAYLLRLVGASVASQRYFDSKEIVRAWDGVAVGAYKNVAHADAARVLYNRGMYDAAADRVVKLVAELDLAALPARVEFAPRVFDYSRRGAVGGHLVLAKWSERVLAGSSFEHVLTLLPVAAQRQGDLPKVLERAAALAGDDVARKLAVARAATQYGQQAYARQVVEPMLKRSPTRELYQLAATMERARSELGAALGYLEKAQEAGADEEVELTTVRGEMREILSVAQQLALQSAGADRARAVATALAWGKRWRAVDQGNAEIDRRLGELLLAVGDGPGAWRQLSSTIERDPWSGSGYITVADMLERQGKIDEALEVWQQAIVIEQTNPTPRLRKAQALIALGRTAEGDALLQQIAGQKWHDIWSGVVYQARHLLERGKAQSSP